MHKHSVKEAVFTSRGKPGASWDTWTPIWCLRQNCWHWKPENRVQRKGKQPLSWALPQTRPPHVFSWCTGWIDSEPERLQWTRAEPWEQPKGKIMGSLISQKLSWRITSCERFYKKWFSLREAELLPDFAQHRFQSYRPDNWGTDWNFCTGETACWSGQYEQMTRFLIQIFDTYFWTNTVRSCVLSCHVYMYSHNTANKKNKQFVFSENHSEEFIIHNYKKKVANFTGNFIHLQFDMRHPSEKASHSPKILLSTATLSKHL